MKSAIGSIAEPLERRVLLAAYVATGGEALVNTTTANDQENPRVASDAQGNYVVAWESFGQDAAGGYGIYARRFDRSGGPLSVEIPVNTTTAGDQHVPAVAMSPNGSFVVVWTSSDGSGNGIFGQRFDAAGAPQGSEFPINSTTSGDQSVPRVSMDSSGNFIVVWRSQNFDGDGYAAVGRRYSSAGVALSSEFQLNATTAGDQDDPSIAVTPAGSFVATWVSESGQDTDGAGVYARLFNSAGIATSGEIPVNVVTTGDQFRPRIAADTAGNFVIAWVDSLQDGLGLGVYARRFDAAGSPLGGEFHPTTFTSGDQNRPEVAVNGEGRFVITWDSGLFGGVGMQDGSGGGIFAHRYNADGTPDGIEFQVNATSAGNQFYPTVAYQTGGAFAITWGSMDGQDGSLGGVYAQRFMPGTIAWDGGAGTNNWTDAANWSTDSQPTTTDDVVISVPTNPTIQISSGTQSIHSLISDEAITVNGGTLSLAAASQETSVLTLTSGTISGTGDLTETGVMNWTGGTISGGGKTIIASGGTLNMSSTTDKTLSRVLQNDGTTTWGGTGIWIFNGGTVNNNGTFTATTTSASPIFARGDGGTNAFNNAPIGIFNKAGVESVQFIQNSTAVPFNNDGVVNVLSPFGNPLYLRSGGSQTGSFNLGSGGLALGGNHTFSAASSITGTGSTAYFQIGAFGGTSTINAAITNLTGGLFIAAGTTTFTAPITADSLSFSAGIANFNAATSIAGGGTLSGGTLGGTGDVSIGGALNWTGGTMSGSGKTIIGIGATLSVTGGPKSTARNIDLAGTLTGDSDLTVLGVLNWTLGTMNGSGKTIIASGATMNVVLGSGQRLIENHGTIDWANDSYGRIDNYGNFLLGSVSVFFGDTFNNFGTFTKSASGDIDIGGISNQGQMTILNTSVTTIATNLLQTGDFMFSGTVLFDGSPTFTDTCDIAAGGFVQFNTGGDSLSCAASINTIGITVDFFPLTLTGSLNLGAIFVRNDASLTLTGPVTTSGNRALRVESGCVLDYGASSLSFFGVGNSLSSSLLEGTITGSGSLTFSGTGSWSGGSINGSGLITIGASGVLNVTEPGKTGTSRPLQIDGQLNVLAGGDKTFVLGALTMSASAKLDLNDNDMILDYTGAPQIGTIQPLINSARAGGWTGNGITSSSAKNNPQHNTTLGAMEATDYKSINVANTSFDGEPIDNTAVLIKYTYYGDANFSGKVDGGDYARIDFTFGQEQSSGNIGGWINGDFNGDGKVDGSDYALTDFAFSSQGAALRPIALPPIGVGKNRVRPG